MNIRSALLVSIAEDDLLCAPPPSPQRVHSPRAVRVRPSRLGASLPLGAAPVSPKRRQARRRRPTAVAIASDRRCGLRLAASSRSIQSTPSSIHAPTQAWGARRGDESLRAFAAQATFPRRGPLRRQIECWRRRAEEFKGVARDACCRTPRSVFGGHSSTLVAPCPASIVPWRWAFDLVLDLEFEAGSFASSWQPRRSGGSRRSRTCRRATGSSRSSTASSFTWSPPGPWHDSQPTRARSAMLGSTAPPSGKPPSRSRSPVVWQPGRLGVALVPFDLRSRVAMALSRGAGEPRSRTRPRGSSCRRRIPRESAEGSRSAAARPARPAASCFSLRGRPAGMLERWRRGRCAASKVCVVESERVLRVVAGDAHRRVVRRSARSRARGGARRGRGTDSQPTSSSWGVEISTKPPGLTRSPPRGSSRTRGRRRPRA